MKLKVIYSVLKNDNWKKKDKMISIPDDLIEKLREWNNQDKTREFLINEIRDLAAAKEKTDNIKIHEFYEQKQKKKVRHQELER